MKKISIFFILLIILLNAPYGKNVITEISKKYTSPTIEEDLFTYMIWSQNFLTRQNYELEEEIGKYNFRISIFPKNSELNSCNLNILDLKIFDKQKEIYSIKEIALIKKNRGNTNKIVFNNQIVSSLITNDKDIVLEYIINSDNCKFNYKKRDILKIKIKKSKDSYWNRIVYIT